MSSLEYNLTNIYKLLKQKELVTPRVEAAYRAAYREAMEKVGKK
jgi:hypothetical protein